MTALKISFRKTALRKIHYSYYDKFNADAFKTELRKSLATSSSNYESFEQAFLASLDKLASYKSKKIRANQVPYMTKNLRKAIMQRSQLKTKYFKRNTAESLRLYKKQNIFCIKWHKKERKKYCNSLKLNKVTDNKAFWKAIKPFLSDKRTNINKITLVDNDKVISDDKQLCKTFTNFFQEAVNILALSD